MHPTLVTGVLLTVVGIAGYAAGVFVAYPGRAFSLTAVMLGLTLWLVGRTEVSA